jgi:hypothetical protein
MYDLYLAVSVWLEYVQFSICINIVYMYDLFSAVSVWLEYVQFSIGGMAAQDGIIKIREVFEKALSSAGLHVTQGSSLWEAYREFENAILLGIMVNLFY